MRLLTNLLIFIYVTKSNAQSLKYSDAPDIPYIIVGTVFKTNSNYKIKGISSNTKEHHYEYLKPISSQIFHRKVDYLTVIVKENIIIGFTYFLIPKSNDYSVPPDIKDDFVKKTGLELGCDENYCGVIYGNLKITIGRTNNVALGGDRIIFLAKYNSN